MFTLWNRKPSKRSGAFAPIANNVEGLESRKMLWASNGQEAPAIVATADAHVTPVTADAVDNTDLLSSTVYVAAPPPASEHTASVHTASIHDAVVAKKGSVDNSNLTLTVSYATLPASIAPGQRFEIGTATMVNSKASMRQFRGETVVGPENLIIEVTYNGLVISRGTIGAGGTISTDAQGQTVPKVKKNHPGVLQTWGIAPAAGVTIADVGIQISAGQGRFGKKTTTFTLPVTGNNPGVHPHFTVNDVISQPTFTVSKTDNKTNANPGDILTYTIVVTNTSAVNATNVPVVDTLPADLTFVSASNGVYANNTVTWTVGTINAGQSTTLTVQTIVKTGTPDGTVLLNSASAGGSVNVGTDTTIVNVPVIVQPTFTVTKTDNRTTANIGDLLNYTITVTNTSAVNATNVPVLDTLSSYLTFVSAGNGGAYTGNNVTWTIPTLSAGASTTLTLQATVKAGAPDGSVISNTANAGGSFSGTDTTIVTAPIIGQPGTDPFVPFVMSITASDYPITITDVSAQFVPTSVVVNNTMLVYANPHGGNFTGAVLGSAVVGQDGRVDVHLTTSFTVYAGGHWDLEFLYYGVALQDIDHPILVGYTKNGIPLTTTAIVGPAAAPDYTYALVA